MPIPRFKDLPIKRKLLLIIISINLFALTLAFSGFIAYEMVILREEAKQELATLSDLIGYNCAAPLMFNDPVDVENALAALKTNDSIITAWIFTEIGKPFAGYIRNDVPEQASPPQRKQDGYYFTGGHLSCFQTVLFEGLPVGTVYIHSDLRVMYSILERHLSVIVIVFLISLLCAGLLSTKLQRIITGNIINLADLAKSVSREKDYSVRGIKQGGDELGTLVDAFNEMLEQIQGQNTSLTLAWKNAEASSENSSRLAEEMTRSNLKLEEAIRVRKRVEMALEKHQEQLEQIVQSRTYELKLSNEQLANEIVERKAATIKIRASLKEKSMLLGEIHHRVRNNLQVISNLLDMTSRRAMNVEARQVISSARSRIFTMGLIHSQLYRSEDFNRIDMETHIRKLWLNVEQIYQAIKKDVVPVIECGDVYLTVSQAIPCALVLNEAITNIFKHAYKGSKGGPCYITMERSDNDRILMRIRDEGHGVPETVDVETADTLGLKLMRNLVRLQLKGEFHIDQNGGTDIWIEFNLMDDDPLVHAQSIDNDI